ncbi:MAG: zinc ribbon domain-containing protein, partial [Nitrososphaerales archaeon]
NANVLPWLLIGLGLALLAGVLAYWLLSQRRTVAASAPATARPRPTTSGAASQPSVRPPARAQAASDAVSFCTNCGHGLKPEDRFCSQCGAPRRS